jgi:hypothetical protein
VPRFTVFRTLAVAAAVYVRNIASFTVLALVVYSPLIAYAIWGMRRAVDADSLVEADERGAVVVLVVFGGTYLLSKVLAGAVAFGVFNQLRSTHVSLGSCLANGVRRLVPVLLTALLLALVIGLATATYILPGVVAACLSYVAIPAAVIEGGGPWKAFTRSVSLVDKAMPRVFMLIVVFVALQIGGYMLVGMLLDSVAPGALTVRICVLMAVTMLFGTFDAVLSSVAYAHLRVDRDGIESSELARVFD